MPPFWRLISTTTSSTSRALLSHLTLLERCWSSLVSPPLQHFCLGLSPLSFRGCVVLAHDPNVYGGHGLLRIPTP